MDHFLLAFTIPGCQPGSVPKRINDGQEALVQNLMEERQQLRAKTRVGWPKGACVAQIFYEWSLWREKNTWLVGIWVEMNLLCEFGISVQQFVVIFCIRERYTQSL